MESSKIQLLNWFSMCGGLIYLEILKYGLKSKKVIVVSRTKASLRHQAWAFVQWNNDKIVENVQTPSF